MSEVQQFLLVVVLTTVLGSVSVLLAAFSLWIYSLRSELNVYAPLVDFARTRRRRPKK